MTFTLVKHLNGPSLKAGQIAAWMSKDNRGKQDGLQVKMWRREDNDSGEGGGWRVEGGAHLLLSTCSLID